MRLDQSVLVYVGLNSRFKSHSSGKSPSDSDFNPTDSSKNRFAIEGKTATIWRKEHLSQFLSGHTRTFDPRSGDCSPDGVIVHQDGFRQLWNRSEGARLERKMATACRHPKVRVVSRHDDTEFVECLECGEVFDSEEFRDMEIEDTAGNDELPDDS